MADDNLEKWPYQIRSDRDIVVGGSNHEHGQTNAEPDPDLPHDLPRTRYLP